MGMGFVLGHLLQIDRNKIIPIINKLNKKEKLKVIVNDDEKAFIKEQDKPK